MQKIPCHCQTDAQPGVPSALRCQISPLDLLSFMKLFLFFTPYTPRSVTFVRWCSWFNKVVFLLCWRPLLSTLCNPDQHIAKLHVDSTTGAKGFIEWSDSEKLKDQSCFIVLNPTVVWKITVRLVNQQKIQQSKMFIISVGKQMTRRNGTEWIHLHKQDKRKNRPADTCSPQPGNMTRLVKKLPSWGI